MINKIEKTSIQIYFSSIPKTASRLLKSCESIISLGLVDKVLIIGYWVEGMELNTELSQNIRAMRIKTLVKKIKIKSTYFKKFIRILSFFEYCSSVVKISSKIKPDFISCHNLGLLPVCVLVKNFVKCKLLYEPHELETDVSQMKFKFISKYIEKIFIKYCDKVVTVSDPITVFYKEIYKLSDDKVLTIRNVPVNPNIGRSYKKNDLFRSEFGICKNSLVYLYQGLIDEDRGISNYLETFVKLDNSSHLVIMGYGSEESLVKEYSKTHKNIHYKSAVPVNEIIKYTSSADVGLFIIPGSLPLSYKYALPNKFYEYAIAGLHICVSENFSFLKEIVKDKKLGSVISSETLGLYNWIKNNKRDPEDILFPSIQSLDFRKNCGWQNEEQSFIKLYT